MALSDAAANAAVAPPAACTGCAGGTLRRDRVSTALWRGSDLVVIEDIPALVCARCGERYFEDETAMALDMMRAGKVGEDQPTRSLSVPVYSYAPVGGGRPEGNTS